MLRCCQSLGRVSAMEKPHPMTIQPCHDLKDTTIEPLDNKEREDLERKTSNTVGIRDDIPDDEEKNDSIKDSVSGSEILEAPQSLSLDGDDVSYSEDNSLDNNTFNIINTEDSQSQEVSDMTNDESPMIVNENGETSASKENGKSKRETDEDSDEELSCLDEEDEDLDEEEEVEEEDETDESGESDKHSTGSDGGEESDDEREFDNESLEDEGKNSDSAICITETIPPLQLPEPPKDTLQSTKQKTGDGKPDSPPKMRRRLRSFGKKENREFTIEIFESRRKPQDTTTTGDTKHNKTTPESENKTINKDIDVIGPLNTSLVSPGSTLTTPDSADNTLVVSLEIDNPIQEETDESDALSPLKSPSDGVLTPRTKSGTVIKVYSV